MKAYLEAIETFVGDIANQSMGEYTFGFELEGIFIKANQSIQKTYKEFHNIAKQFFGPDAEFDISGDPTIHILDDDVVKCPTCGGYGKQEGEYCDDCVMGAIRSGDAEEDDFTFEAKSPPLRLTYQNIYNVKNFLKYLRDNGIAYSNRTCGFHIHIGLPELAQEDISLAVERFWIVCILAANKDELNKITSVNGFSLTSDKWSPSGALFRIYRRLDEYDNTQIALEDIKMFFDSEKYTLIGQHPLGTIEWRGPRGVLDDENKINIVDDFFKTTFTTFIKMIRKAKATKRIINDKGLEITKEQFHQFFGKVFREKYEQLELPAKLTPAKNNKILEILSGASSEFFVKNPNKIKDIIKLYPFITKLNSKTSSISFTPSLMRVGRFHINMLSLRDQNISHTIHLYDQGDQTDSSVSIRNCSIGKIKIDPTYKIYDFTVRDSFLSVDYERKSEVPRQVSILGSTSINDSKFKNVNMTIYSDSENSITKTEITATTLRANNSGNIVHFFNCSLNNVYIDGTYFMFNDCNLDIHIAGKTTVAFTMKKFNNEKLSITAQRTKSITSAHLQQIQDESNSIDEASIKLKTFFGIE